MILSRVGVINNIGNYGRRLGWINPPSPYRRQSKEGEPWSPTCRGKGDISGYGTTDNIMCVFRRGVKNTFVAICLTCLSHVALLCSNWILSASNRGFQRVAMGDPGDF